MTAKYQGYVRNANGQALPGKSITVYLASTGALATLTNELGVAIANPVTSRGDGYYSLYCESGRYNLIVDGQPVSDVIVAQPIMDPGQRAVNTLRLASDVVSATKVTIGVDVLEIEIVNTDSADNTAGGSFVPTTEISILAATYPHLSTTVGTLIRIEDEIMRLTAYSGGYLTYSRGQSGTTAATHADATDIYKGDGIAAGSTIAVGLVATLTPTAFAPALVADFNALGVEPITMTQISVNEILLIADSVGAVVTACTENLAGANNAFTAAVMYGGKAQALANISIQQRVPKTQEVTLGNLQLSFNFTPTVVNVRVCPTATPGLDKLWSGTITISGGLVTLANVADMGHVDWAATDTVTVTAFG